jgi:hypothetical protein
MINTKKYNQLKTTEIMEDKRQLLIVRQSQLERALEYYKMMDIQPDPVLLITTAELFKNFVFDGLSPDVITKCKSLDEKVIQRQKKGVIRDEYPLTPDK